MEESGLERQLEFTEQATWEKCTGKKLWRVVDIHSPPLFWSTMLHLCSVCLFQLVSSVDFWSIISSTLTKFWSKYNGLWLSYDYADVIFLLPYNGRWPWHAPVWGVRDVCWSALLLLVMLTLMVWLSGIFYSVSILVSSDYLSINALEDPLKASVYFLLYMSFLLPNVLTAPQNQLICVFQSAPLNYLGFQNFFH